MLLFHAVDDGFGRWLLLFNSNCEDLWEALFGLHFGFLDSLFEQRWLFLRHKIEQIITRPYGSNSNIYIYFRAF